jgi:hypothetical protein
VIADSARRHGVRDEDMLHAYRNPSRIFELDDGSTMLIGRQPDCDRDRGGSRPGRHRAGHRSRDARTRKVSEVMSMPRTVEDILKHAEELAKRFEDYEPDPDDERDPDVIRALRQAVMARSDAERVLRDAVGQARQAGWSWTLIGSLLGTSGEAARQRYGQPTRGALESALCGGSSTS